MFQEAKKLASASFLPPLLLCAVFTVFITGFLSRPLWFDEVLNLTNFALGRTPTEIYANYVIPNNHLLFSVLLSWWARITPFFGNCPIEVALRLLPFGFGLASLWFGFRLFHRRLSAWALFPALLALAVCPAFLIYGTALRGYMPSLFFLILTTDAALNLAQKVDVRRVVLYFLWCWCALAVIPSNLFAIGATVLYALPLLGAEFYRRKAFYLLALEPFLALGMIYGPIWRNFLGCVALQEGWADRFGALAGVNAFLATAFCMLLFPMAAGGVICASRKSFRWIFSARILLLFLPVIPCMVLTVAPFPRTFFPFAFPVLLVGAAGLKHLFAYFCFLRRRWNRRWLLFGLIAIVVGWGGLLLFSPECRLALGLRCGGVMRDDFFAPYYTLPSFRPAETAMELRRLGVFPVFASFGSDPYALSFYASLFGLPREAIRFDNPRGKAPRDLPVAVLRCDESPDAPGTAFLPGKWRELPNQSGFYRIYRRSSQTEETGR